MRQEKQKTTEGIVVPCLVTVKVSGHITSKVEPVIKDWCKRLI